MSGVGFYSSRSPGGEPVPFRDALLAGLAPDGGLYLPDRIPSLPQEWLQFDSFTELAWRVLERWVGEPREGELAALVEDALDLQVPLHELSGDRWVVELFHGPTLSFKDFGARTMARLMNHYLGRAGERLTVLVATSGDTGSAVADGFAGLDYVRVVLLYPKGMVSEVQERQLRAARPGLVTLAVQGNFDDCQRLVKGAFADPHLSGVRLSSANSINVGRLLPQQLYYLWATNRLARLWPGGAPPVVSVPSGNLGNLTAGLIAAAAGMQAGRFLAAHNANDYFPDFLGGRRQAYAFPETRSTISNAMDVGSPSNFERIVNLLPGGLGDRVWAASVDDDATRQRLRATYEEDGYLACPHTAVGLEAVDRYRLETGDRSPALSLATAHPAKFPGTVAAATGRRPPTSERLLRLLEAPQRALDVRASGEALREVLLAWD